MNSKTAENLLWQLAYSQGEYYDTKSHSIIRSFKQSVPKREVRAFVGVEYQEPKPFVKDEFKWDGKIYSKK